MVKKKVKSDGFGLGNGWGNMDYGGGFNFNFQDFGSANSSSKGKVKGKAGDKSGDWLMSSDVKPILSHDYSSVAAAASVAYKDTKRGMRKAYWILRPEEKKKFEEAAVKREWAKVEAKRGKKPRIISQS